jgi:hypothetical protein
MTQKIDTLEINYRTAVADEQTDAIWYYGDTVVATATLTLSSGETYSLDICCDGETRYDIPYLNEDGTFDADNRQVIRYARDWEALGVCTDEQLASTVHDWDERGVEIHRYNSWFDLYTEIDGVSLHIDAVTHTTTDAEAQAEAILQEVATHGGWKQYLETL